MWDIQRAIASSGIRKSYVAYCRVDSINRRRALLEAWQEIGLHCLLVGIEAVRPVELADYNKDYSLSESEQALAYARSQGLTIQGLFIIHPQWGRKEFAALRRFIERHRIDHPTFTVLTPLPGTDTLGGIGDNVLARTPDGAIDWAKFDLMHPVVATTLPIKEFEREVSELFRLYKPVRWPHDPVRHERVSHPLAAHGVVTGGRPGPLTVRGRVS
jgi:methyltransferase